MVKQGKSVTIKSFQKQFTINSIVVSNRKITCEWFRTFLFLLQETFCVFDHWADDYSAQNLLKCWDKKTNARSKKIRMFFFNILIENKILVKKLFEDYDDLMCIFEEMYKMKYIGNENIRVEKSQELLEFFWDKLEKEPKFDPNTLFSDEEKSRKPKSFEFKTFAEKICFSATRKETENNRLSEEILQVLD